MARFITELHMPKKLRKARSSGDGDLAYNSLSKYGFRSIGHGEYASVYENPEYPYVLKVFAEDDGYLEWLAFCKKNQDNPYIPKLRGSFVKVIPKQEIYAVRLEKLYPCSPNKYRTLDKKIDKGFDAIENNTSMGKIDTDLQKIIQYLYYQNNVIDWKRENIMQRENGQVVIIDPLR